MGQLDKTVVERLRESVGDEAFAEIARDFIADSKRIEQGLRAALKNADPVAARASAHELRGLAGTFGAALLEQSCREIEARGGAALREVHHAVELCSKVRDDMKRVIGGGRVGAA